MYISSLVLIVDYGKKLCHFCYNGMCELKVNNWGKCLTLFETILLIKEKWLSLLVLLNTGSSSQLSSGMLLEMGENTF